MVLNKFSQTHSAIKVSFIPQLPIEIVIVEICRNISSGATIDGTTKGPDNTEYRPNKSTKISENKSVSTGDVNVENAKDSIKEKSQVEECVEAKIEIKYEAITNCWDEVLKRTLEINNTVHGLLRNSNPITLEGNTLVLEVYYSFHKERLESIKNRKIVEDVLSDVYSNKIKIRCDVSSSKPEKLKKYETGVLTDYNVVPSSIEKEFKRDAVIEMLDGGLPIL
jgi:hypothetical protein